MCITSGPGVQVGAIHVDLAAMIVDDPADVADAGLEHTVGRGIGDHEGGEPVLVFGRLGPKIVQIDVAARIAGDHHHRHAGHGGAGGIGAVGGGRDQANVAVPLPAALVVLADHQEPGVLALRTGVRLQGHGGETGEVDQPRFEVADQRQVTLGLVERREGMDVRKFRPGDRDHLGRRVQLHGA
jgi:hypothetical protein